MAVPVSELQTPNIDNIVELFQLELNTTIHGVSQTYYFHNGVGINNDANLIFANNEYTRMPIEAEGFEFNGKQLPRPTLKISNIFGDITTILLTLPQGLEGAKVTRIRTLRRFIDDDNFEGGDILLEDGSQDVTSGGVSVLTLEIPDVKRNVRISLDGTDAAGTDAEDSIVLEVGLQKTTTQNILLSEEGLRAEVTVPSSEDIFLLEGAFIDVQHENSRIISEDIEIIENRGGFILLDGTSIGLESDRLISETSKLELPVIVLDGTDENSSDANSKLLGIENEGFEEIVLNGIDSSSTFAGDNIILETPIDFSNNDVVITCLLYTSDSADEG